MLIDAIKIDLSSYQWTKYFEQIAVKSCFRHHQIIEGWTDRSLAQLNRLFKGLQPASV